VAICEQTEDPKAAKGLVKRDIIRVITPGTVMEQSMLDESRNNYICSMYSSDKKIGICFCDISTGELYATDISGRDYYRILTNQLASYSPREILFGGDIINLKQLPEFIKSKLSAGVEMLDDDKFELSLCRETVEQQFPDEMHLISDKPVVISSVGALINYLRETQMSGLERINHLEIYNEAQYMRLDYNTQRNLELTQTMLSKTKRGSLLWVIDKTKTAMGKRLIRSWLDHPLMNISKINNRQSAVEELVNDTVLRLELTATLSGIYDIERIMTKIVYGSANARDLRSLCSAITDLPQISDLISGCQSSYMRMIYKDLDLLEDIHSLIDSAIVDDPPFSVREGGMIREGYNKELDIVNSDMNNSKDILSQIEAQEREKTGIPKLKIGYNRVYGYFLEVTNFYKNLVPDTYIRKQTLTGSERYITPDLKDLESRILGAKDRAIAMEYTLFETIRTTVSDNLERIQNTAKALATLDALTSLANVASDNRYVRPEVNQSTAIVIKDSRHPVVELLLRDSSFVPNDVNLDTKGERVDIITGPNMAGKSTYMRQIALIVLMAQMGSFVPASSAKIGIVDSIFTRVGASDDLASGQSTFMVEMNEVANIVKNATSRSLLILDEIG
ncbi:MAG: DNA mismatch repair protein MutS, partial [Ruminococcus sp.]|nr:DNA mismatch repair protein MutS [Ruminococcus sp.]